MERKRNGKENEISRSFADALGTFLSLSESWKLDIQVVSVSYLVHNETLKNGININENDLHFMGIYKLHILESTKHFCTILASTTIKWLGNGFFSHKNSIASCGKEEHFAIWNRSPLMLKLKKIIQAKSNEPKWSKKTRQILYIKFFLFISICVFENICSDLV